MTPDLRPIRAATRSDAPALHGLIERGYRGASARLGWSHPADLVDGERTNIAELLGIMADPAQAILVAKQGKEPVGCVHVADEGGGICGLGLLCVEPRLQGGGLGTRLVAAAERVAVARFGAVRIEMTVIERRTELIAYYGRRGYSPTGARRPFPVEGIDLPLVVLARVIGPARGGNPSLTRRRAWTP